MTSIIGLAAVTLIAIFTWVGVVRRAPLTRWRRVLGSPISHVQLAKHEHVTPTVNLTRLGNLPASRLLSVLIIVICGLGGLALSGPVAGLVLVAYSSTAVILAARRRSRREQDRSRGRAVDTVAALAAELRAGLPVAAALSNAANSLEGSVVGKDATTVARRVAAAVEVAEASGAPLAEVLDRLDVHLRATDRARASASAQAAGASASAGLLALMPVAGAALGYLVGVDATQVLLHTPLGAACLLGAVVLQLSGLVWAGRLSRVEVAP